MLRERLLLAEFCQQQQAYANKYQTDEELLLDHRSGN